MQKSLGSNRGVGAPGRPSGMTREPRFSLGRAGPSCSGVIGAGRVGAMGSGGAVADLACARTRGRADQTRGRSAVPRRARGRRRSRGPGRQPRSPRRSRTPTRGGAGGRAAHARPDGEISGEPGGPTLKGVASNDRTEFRASKACAGAEFGGAATADVQVRLHETARAAGRDHHSDNRPVYPTRGGNGPSATLLPPQRRTSLEANRAAATPRGRTALSRSLPHIP